MPPCANSLLKLLTALALLLPALPVACKSGQNGQAGASGQPLSAPARIVAVGDLHGDLDATRRALRLAGAIDASDAWIGGEMALVQTGDQIDRGDGDLAILELFETLRAQAEAAGGQVHALNGNHEIMNAQLDFRYVTEQGFSSFAAIPGLRLDLAPLAPLPAFARPRAAAFAPGGPWALKLARRQSVLVFGGNVFVHGGLLPQHLDYGIARINQTFSAWLTRGGQLPAILADEVSPIWNRLYSAPAAPADCGRLSETLTRLGARRMIVGHTVQPRINSACDDKVWRIDVGMARVYGGPVQVLEIRGDQVQVLTEAAPAP